MQFALKAQVERFVAKDKEVRCAKDWEEVNVAKDWEEERFDIKDWEEEWLAIKDVKEVKQKLRDAMDSLEVLFLLYDPKVRMLLDALMFQLVRGGVEKKTFQFRTCFELWIFPLHPRPSSNIFRIYFYTSEATPDVLQDCRT